MELTETQIKILDQAKKQFLEHGYKSASLRQIVKDAGFTLGAFYGYYASKEELFNALVDETAMGIVSILKGISDEMDALPKEERMMKMSSVYITHLPSLVDYLFDHYDEVILLFSKSEGTKYQNYLNQIQGNSQSNTVSRIEGSTQRIGMNPMTLKMIMNSYYSMIFNVIVSGMKKEDVLNVMIEIQEFYQYGMLGMVKK